MSLLAMSLGLRFCTSRKGGTRALGSAVEGPWTALGGPFLSYFAKMGIQNSILAM